MSALLQLADDALAIALFVVLQTLLVIRLSFGQQRLHSLPSLQAAAVTALALALSMRAHSRL